ncbi:multidrug effflux MFS transporter [Thalassomonas haliotis]|uniref:Bcr/CflA family efflux transporter n=1 Tax=Thalassomonas haliotis TaxID=485448 RepID=A0ABY7VFZ1_9GAMM|nr:multidrug effflux MFS transporter [Thalassomonas haliotis]WDE12478.1 multidrug effflux MFS transporter [Thalassomonas haliotis]
MTTRNSLPLLMLMVIFSPLAIDIFLPALPVMAQDFAAPMSQVQWSISAFLLTMGLGQLLSGPLADRFGRKPVALTGVVIYGLSSLLCVFAASLEAFLFFRLAQGFGACAIVVAAFACVRDKYNPIQSGVIYSYLNGAICCIPALAPILGSILTERFGWRSNFEVMALYAAVAGVIMFFTLSETRPASTVQPKKLLSLKSFMPIVKHPVFLFNATIVMLMMSIMLAFVSSSPAWLMIELKQSQHSFVFWFSLNAALNIAACFFAPKVLTRLGARHTIGLGMGILVASGILMLALQQWHHAAAFMLPIMICSTGVSLLAGTCSGQALSPFGDNAGSASALLGFLQMSGAAVLVALLQLLPLNAPQQMALLILAILPIYALWQLPKMKSTLYQLPAANV